jgi:hypothetical protein
MILALAGQKAKGGAVVAFGSMLDVRYNPPIQARCAQTQFEIGCFAEWNYWTTVQHLLREEVLHGWKAGEPFPPLEAIRPKAKG